MRAEQSPASLQQREQLRSMGVLPEPMHFSSTPHNHTCRSGGGVVHLWTARDHALSVGPPHHQAIDAARVDGEHNKRATATVKPRRPGKRERARMRSRLAQAHCTACPPRGG